MYMYNWIYIHIQIYIYICVHMYRHTHTQLSNLSRFVQGGDLKGSPLHLSTTALCFCFLLFFLFFHPMVFLGTGWKHPEKHPMCCWWSDGFRCWHLLWWLCPVVAGHTRRTELGLEFRHWKGWELHGTSSMSPCLFGGFQTIEMGLMGYFHVFQIFWP